MTIQKSLQHGILVTALGVVGTLSGFASEIGAIDVTFDENGNGTWQDNTVGGATQNGYSGNSGTLTALYEADPTSSIVGNVLVYKLPELVFSGAVDVGKPGDTLGVDDSDAAGVLFFTNSSGVDDGGADANLLIFYSANVAGGGLADTGLPALAGTLENVVDENANGSFQWLPNFVTYPIGNEYDGLDGTTPEPGSMALAGIGLAGLALAARRRRAA